MGVKPKIIPVVSRTCLAVVSLVCLISAAGFAQSTSARLDSLMRTLAARGQFNGSVLIAEHGSVVYENGFGLADAGKNIPFTPATPCYLASLSKQFTAMAVMMLAEQRKLSYDDPLTKYVPSFPPYARSVTLRHLLNHTSGIPDYVGLGLERPGLTNDDVLKALVGQDSLDFTPGEQFRYSNSGYVLLAMIVEKVSGETYGAFLQRRIFEPLGMNHTFVRDASRRDVPDAARGVNRFGANDDYDLLTAGDGGIYSSADDLFKWDQALYTEKLVKSSTLAEAFSRGRLNDGTESGYGFGWGIMTYKGETIETHAGRYGGFNTYIKRFPKERNTIIFLTNHDFKDMGAIGNALAGVLYDEPYTLPKRSVAEAMYKLYEAKGPSPALQLYRRLKESNDTTYDYRESELNELGYQLLSQNRIVDAIAVLVLNAEGFPSSWNVYDSLGEAYAKHGDRDLAIVNYKKSLGLNPQNSNAIAALQRLAGGK